MAGEYSLTNANILAAGTGANGYQEWTIKDDANRSWNAFAIKNQHSKATADKHYLQIKKYASNTAYYIQIPDLGEPIQSITMTVSNTQKTMDGGSNTATLFFSASESTDAEGTGVASGTGESSVTIDASALGLTGGYITAGGAVRVWDVVVTTSGGVTPPSVATPVISGEAEFTESTQVTITCKDASAAIYYTLDGADPTTNSLLYDEPFTLTETATVKAVAYDIENEEYSAVATKTFTKKEPLKDPTNCAEAREAALSVSKNNEEYNGGKEYTIEGYVTSIAKPYDSQFKNVSFWIADAADGGNVIQAYRAACETEADAPNVGDKVSVTGKLTKYNTTPEFAAACTFVILQESAPAVNLGAKTIAEFLELKNMKDTCVLTGTVENIKSTVYGNLDLRDETGVVYVYGVLTPSGENKKFEELGVAEGDEMTILAIYNEYNSEPQVKDAIFVSVKKTPTGIENTAVEAKAFKTFENGQLVIIKNGVKYDVTGAVIR